jgi:hypothetical protein
MPRIKRWFPVSHDINADPEVWAMRHQIGEKSLSIWLEFLSIADRNESELPGDYEELIRLVAGRCQAAQRTVTGVYQFALSRLWLTCQPTLRVVKWSKYHRVEERKPVPSEPSEPNLTDQTGPNPPNPPKRGRAVGDLTFEKFWSIYPKKNAKRVAYRAWCKEAQHCSDVQNEIFAALGWQINQPQWIKDNGQYIPNPATWLNQGRWKDERPITSVFTGELNERLKRSLTRGL